MKLTSHLHLERRGGHLRTRRTQHLTLQCVTQHNCGIKQSAYFDVQLFIIVSDKLAVLYAANPWYGQLTANSLKRCAIEPLGVRPSIPRFALNASNSGLFSFDRGNMKVLRFSF